MSQDFLFIPWCSLLITPFSFRYNFSSSLTMCFSNPETRGDKIKFKLPFKLLHMYMYYKHFRSKVCHTNGKISIGGPVCLIFFLYFQYCISGSPTVSNYTYLEKCHDCSSLFNPLLKNQQYCLYSVSELCTNYQILTWSIRVQKLPQLNILEGIL